MMGHRLCWVVLVVFAVAGAASAQSLIVTNGATVYIDHAGQVDLGTATTLKENGGRVTGGTGTITGVRNLNAPAAVDVAGLGAVLTSSAQLGTTRVTRGFLPAHIGSNPGVARYFDIQPSHNTALNATLRFTWLDAELGGLSEPDLIVFRSTDAGASWQARGGTAQPPVNAVTLDGIDGFSRWTAALNQPPALVPDQYGTNTNTPLSVPAPGVLGNDGSGPSLIATAASVTTSGGGVVHLASDGSFDYLPAGGFHGSDQFLYQACDGTGCATAAVTLKVLGAQTITNFAATPANPTFTPGGTFTVSATGGASGNPVVFSSATASVCTVSGSTVTMQSAGTCTLHADQAGNANYAAAPQETLNVTLGKATQTLSVTAPSNVALSDGSTTVTVSASSGLAVTFTTTTPSICTVSGSAPSFSIVLHGAGSCQLTAEQAGDASSAAATEDVSIDVQAASMPAATPVPTLGWRGLLALIAGIGLIGLVAMRRQTGE